MYKNIIVTLENSPTDQVIVDHIAILSKATGAKVTLLHVADGFVARNQENLNLQDSEEMAQDRVYLEKRQVELSAKGVSSSTVLLAGDPAEKIVEFASGKQCDLIAMATHGHRFLGDIIHGSVAEEVRHKTEIPVLMVKAPK